MQYKTYQLQEVCSFIDYRGKTPPKTTEGIPLITAKIVKNGMIQKPQEFIAADFYDEWMRRGTPKKGSVIFTTEAPLGEVARIQTDEKLAFAQRIIIMEPDTDLLDADYLFYALQDITLKSRIQARATGTTVIGIKSAELKKVLIDLPTLNVQKKIASILSALDDKIALNQQINNNLEQQAQAIFKSWFIDFEPFKGVMPNDWEISCLGKFVEIKRGGSPRPIQNYLCDDGLYWLKISDVTSLNTPFILEIKEHIKEEGIKKTVFLKAGQLVLSNSATPAIPKILDVDSCIHDGWLYFTKSKFSIYYLYLLFKYIRKDLISLGNGSVFTNLKTDILKNFEVIKADDEILLNFDNLVEPIFNQILNMERENQRLKQLRDTLLPKLMSGEIDVNGRM